MRLLASFAAALALSSCGYTFPYRFPYRIDVQQGNYITEEMAGRVKIGMSKGEVRQALGTPLLVDAFHANQWDYYFSNVRNGKAEAVSRLSIVFRDEKVASIEGKGRPGPAATIGDNETPRPSR